MKTNRITGSRYRTLAEPAAFTSASINAAIDQLVAAGGGTLLLNAGTYLCAETIRLRSNVHIRGAGFSNNITSNVPEDTELLIGGTILQAVGSIIVMGANTEDLASALTAVADYDVTSPTTSLRRANQFASNALQNVRLENFSIKGGSVGIKIGAQNNYGMLRGSIENVYIEACSACHIRLENFQTSRFTGIYTAAKTINNSIGQLYLASVDQSILIPGDSVFTDLMSATSFRNNKGLVFGTNPAFNARLNDLQGIKIQTNKLGEVSVFNECTTGATPGINIPVTNCEFFPVDIPVWFRTTANTDYRDFAGSFSFGNGLNDQGINQIYFIKSRSAATGAGTVQVCSRVGGAAIATTGTDTGRRIWTGGYAGIEANNVAPNALTNTVFIGMNAEGIHAPSFVGAGLSGGKFHINDILDSSICNVVLRLADNTLIENTCGASSGITTDLDNAAASSIFIGKKHPTIKSVGPTGSGLVNGRIHTARDFTVANGVAGTASTRLGNGSNGGQIQIVATAVAAAGNLAVVTLPTLTENFSNYYPNIIPANAAAQALTGAAAVRANTTGRGTGFDLVSDGIIPNGTYIYNVQW